MSRHALLLMDLMELVVPAFGGDDALLGRLGETADAARRAGVAVIHVRVFFRRGYPEISGRNAIFAKIAAHFDFTENNPAIEFHPAVMPKDRDILVTKRRVSAFSGSDLEVVLRSLEVDHLTLSGVATSGVVLSTLRLAADMDYDLTVLSDGCADRDAEVHRVLMEKVFPAQARVETCAQWVAGL